VTVQTPRKIIMAGRHCQCGALRAGNSHRCEKCQARASWYRHNCRRPRRSTAHPARTSTRNHAGTRARKQRSTEES
jgi:hypothetical protein